MTKKISIFIIIVVSIFITIIIIKTFNTPVIDNNSKQKSSMIVNNDYQKQITRFSEGIQIPTIGSINYQETDFAPFDLFIRFLKESYPIVFNTMEFDTINKYGLILRWEGTDKKLKPILFLSHYDVVPVENYDPANQDTASSNNQKVDKWDFGPFSGKVTNGRIYGRGTLDMKGMLFSLLDAAEILIDNNFIPKRDIYFAFGQDEETGGTNGALKIAEYFKQQQLRFDAVYDEGGIVAASGTASIMHDVAMIGVAEKGKSTLKITVYGPGGHSSMPQTSGTIYKAAEIIEKLEKNQMKAQIIPPVADFLSNISTEMPFFTRMVINNQWLFRPILKNKLSKNKETNAMIHTTTALTMINSGNAANVLPTQAEITVNFRILPGNNIKDVLNHVTQICKGYDTKIESLGSREPSPVSPTNTKGYENLVKTIKEVYPQAIITPYLTIGATDAWKYYSVSDNVYRFMPIILNPEEQQSIHNINENISIDNYKRMIYFFKTLIENFDN